MNKEMRRVKSQIAQVDSVVREEYQENLMMLRLFLDNNGYPMPRPKWKYNEQDESTWLFTHRKDLNKNFMMLQARHR